MAGRLPRRDGALLKSLARVGDDAIQIVLDRTQLEQVRAQKQKAARRAGDFTDVDEDDEDEAP